jgi:uncharacterized protein (TIGR02284 family)
MNPKTAFDDATRGALRDLLSINIDSYKGWETAAQQTNEPSLQTFFHHMSNVRRENADELRHFVELAGDTPAENGSVSGALHRWWVDAKQALTGGDTKSVLNEAERGEDSILHTYEKAIPDIHNPNARRIVERQFQAVSASHDRIKVMRDRFKNAPEK